MDEFEAIENECKQAAPKQKSTSETYRKVFQPDPAKRKKKLFDDSDSEE